MSSNFEELTAAVRKLGDIGERDLAIKLETIRLHLIEAVSRINETDRMKLLEILMKEADDASTRENL